MSSDTIKIDYTICFETVPDPNFLIDLVMDHGNPIIVDLDEDDEIRFVIGPGGQIDPERRDLLRRILYLSGLGPNRTRKAVRLYETKYGLDELFEPFCMAISSFYRLRQGRFPDGASMIGIESIAIGLEFFTDPYIMDMEDMRKLFKRISAVYLDVDKKMV